MEYEARTGNLASESGVMLTDDRLFGYSTDGLVGDDGLIEIKCPVDSVKIMDMLTTCDVSEYMHQMQLGMWISNRKWCDFIQYVPALEHVGKDLFYMTKTLSTTWLLSCCSSKSASRHTSRCSANKPPEVSPPHIASDRPPGVLPRKSMCGN
jgi:hypothetical protein